jgi:hypothetical protein
MYDSLYIQSVRIIFNTCSKRFSLNMQEGRLETASHHRSQKGIESDINRNCQQNAKEKFPSDGPAEKNGRRIDEKKKKRTDNLRSVRI